MSTRPWEAKMMGDHRRIELMKERIEADEALMVQLLWAFEHHVEQTRPINHSTAAITALRKRLESSNAS